MYDPKDLNKAVKSEYYPIKTVEDVLSKTTWGQSILHFGCYQWVLADSPRRRIIAPDLFQHTVRAISVQASAVWNIQRVMEELFDDIELCEVIAHDLMVWGRDNEEHDQRLRKVLDRAREVQLKLNKKKCKIRVKEVSYIGACLRTKASNQIKKKCKQF